MKGHEYNGEFVNSKPHGNGKETWSDGSSFEGKFVNGMKQSGTFTWKADSQHKEFATIIDESYNGEFKQNLFHGTGRYNWRDGRSYEGEWAYGQMNGRGIYKWLDGRVYEGEFENDLRNG